MTQMTGHKQVRIAGVEFADVDKNKKNCKASPPSKVTMQRNSPLNNSNKIIILLDDEDEDDDDDEEEDGDDLYSHVPESWESLKPLRQPSQLVVLQEEVP